MTIRKASAGDIETIVSLTKVAYAPYDTMLDAPPVPVTEDYALRIDAGEVWLAEAGADAVGLIVLERNEDHAMIFSIAVDPVHQGNGFGIRLLDWTQEQTRSWDLPELRLYTNAKMERNIALYRWYGFHETGRRPNPYRQGWVLVDMAKIVGAERPS